MQSPKQESHRLQNQSRKLRLLRGPLVKLLSSQIHTVRRPPLDRQAESRRRPPPPTPADAALALLNFRKSPVTPKRRVSPRVYFFPTMETQDTRMLAEMLTREGITRALSKRAPHCRIGITRGTRRPLSLVSSWYRLLICCRDEAAATHSDDGPPYRGWDGGLTPVE